jgi:hypothetical protein
VINGGRLLGGGLVASGVLIVCEAAVYSTYWPDVQHALAERGVALELFTVSGNVASIVANLLTGLALVFFYVAARPRFGPGPRTALIVASALWLGGYVVLLCALFLLGLFPGRILLLWSVLGLAELTLAALVGAWIYREDADPR